MTNQAAQTMPELPDPAFVTPDDNLYTVHQMRAMYRQGYDAALAQTAGVHVADDEVLVALRRGEGYEDVHPQLVAEDAIDDRWPEWRIIAAAPAASGGEYPECSGDPASCPENEGHGCCKPNPKCSCPSGDGSLDRPCKAHPPSAASGGEDGMCPNCVTPWKCNGPHALPPSAPHPDALQDGTLSKSTAKRVEALSSKPNTVTPSLSSESAASVSERARELLATEYDNEGVHGLAESIRAGTFTTHLDQCSINAITNALASAPDGFALVPVEPTEAMKDAGDYSKWNYDDAADIYKAMLRAAGYAARGTKEPVFALEQALTQQRGEPSVRIEDLGIIAPMRHPERADAEQAYSITAHDFEKNPIGSRDWTIYWRGWWHRSHLCTTPQPSADAVRELVK